MIVTFYHVSRITQKCLIPKLWLSSPPTWTATPTRQTFRTENLNQILVQDLRPPIQWDRRPPIQWDLRHQKLWGLHVLHGHTVVKSLTALSSIPVVKIYLDTTTQNIATSKSQSSCTSGSRSKMRSQKSSAHTASSSSHKTLTGDTFCGYFYVGVYLYNLYQPNLKLTKWYGYLKSGRV